MRTLKRAGLALTLILTIGLSWVWFVWSDDGAPIWWVLKGRHFERVVVRWNGKTLDSRSPQVVARFDTILRSGRNPLGYATRCLPDDKKDHRDWGVTLYDSHLNPLEIDVGLDGCGAFYLPSVDTTYTSNPDFLTVCNATFGLPK